MKYNRENFLWEEVDAVFRKFLAAVILAVFMLSAQIAFAADVDWNKAPIFVTKDELATYIENGRRKGQTTFYFIFLSEKISNQVEFDNFNFELAQYIAPAPNVHLELVTFGTGKFICKITKDFPGNHVANAYLSREPHIAWKNLTNEEQKLYNIAVGIVDEANKRNSEVEKARYIHNEICKRVLQYKNENERDKTALGALIDGYAQCQGYSDAFYMLGRMAGLNVRRIGGKFDGSWHFWNTITLSDGKTYFVDVTMDDGYNTHEWFLANFEVMKRHHSCEWSIIPNLQ